MKISAVLHTTLMLLCLVMESLKTIGVPQIQEHLGSDIETITVAKTLPNLKKNYSWVLYTYDFTPPLISILLQRTSLVFFKSPM